MTSASSNNISANDGDTSPSSSSSKVSSAAPTSHLGDIMQSASASAVPDMHNMTTSTSLQSITTHIPTHLGFTPLQRILLTANGNVQRILSSYYNSTVSVEILRNDKRPCTSFIIPAVISPTTILLEENGTATSSNSSSYTTDKKSDNLLLVYDRKVRLWCKDRVSKNVQGHHLSVFPQPCIPFSLDLLYSYIDHLTHLSTLYPPH